MCATLHPTGTGSLPVNSNQCNHAENNTKELSLMDAGRVSLPLFCCGDSELEEAPPTPFYFV